MSLFRRKEKPKVELSKDVLMKCQCAKCPVQAESACSRPKIQKAMELMSKISATGSMSGSGMPAGSIAMQASPPEVSMPNPEELPGPYCAIGTAACKDLDNRKACICVTCQVYKDLILHQERVEHFNGKAQ
ncbi:MAG: hypothetical protein ACBZ72_03415 [Candidatus Bathyarchaeia archaeon]